MWVLLLVYVEVLIGFIYLFRAHYFFWLILPPIYLIGWYLDGAEQTGKRSWLPFRSLSLWDHFTATKFRFANKAQLRHMQNRRMVFIALGNKTNMGLLSGFGLRGRDPHNPLADLETFYVVPWILLAIPGLREFLLWSGAVGSRQDPMGTILGLVKRGHSVVYCPRGMEAPGESHDQFAAEERLDPSLFEYAKQHQLYLVPVLIEGETERYSFTHPLGAQRHIAFGGGYRFPLLFWPRYLAPHPPPLLTITVGTPTDPTLEDCSVQQFSQLFWSQVDGLLHPEEEPGDNGEGGGKLLREVITGESIKDRK